MADAVRTVLNDGLSKQCLTKGSDDEAASGPPSGRRRSAIEGRKSSTQPRQLLRRSRRNRRLTWVAGCLGLFMPALVCYSSWGSLGAPSVGESTEAVGSRSLLQTQSPTGSPLTLQPTTLSPTTEGALYPPDAFSRQQVKDGAVILYICGIFYMFAGLALICDDYFVPALEVITERLELSEDVAGATFMAAGGSAPELFTSLIGVFFAKSNVGFGTIVGSAIFNVLFVIGACAVATRSLALEQAKEKHKAGGELLPWYKQGLELTWWPLARDSFFYGVDLVVLLIFFLDDEIWWYEALVMLALYGVYVVFMKYNEQVHAFVQQRLGKVSPEEGSRVQVQGAGTRDDEEASRSRQPRVEEAAPVTRQRSMSIKQVEREVRRESRRISHGELQAAAERRGSRSSDQEAANRTEEAGGSNGGDDDDGGPWTPSSAWAECESIQDRLKFFALFPLNVALWATVPNCQNEDKKDLFVVAFSLSIAWIGVFSYFMVWWADVTGKAADIPAEVMGLTLLAAGTSVPDLITSIVVARAGHGDMAVSSSIGSNIFDICFGLPLPWFLYGLTVNKGSKSITVTSNSLGSSVIMLFGMLVATIVCIALFGWKLNTALGGTSVFLYCIFMTFTLLIEYEKIDGIK
eukprot:TRINITY_DN3740_c0_g1_i1.p1 TRINITY_DN3740_c0_g1~~TRINITY_DN3740_c0_g1_i1.p1  ORF type:complete len:656 (+),score=129.77 TRINITY_DN3740_c0_g1_i1:71-1969(+)